VRLCIAVISSPLTELIHAGHVMGGQVMGGQVKAVSLLVLFYLGLKYPFPDEAIYNNTGTDHPIPAIPSSLSSASRN
jgi:hypothetical protein